MNTLKEVKPLIEWEKYLGVWMVDLLPKQHLVEYTKMDAFEKIGISNVRDWGVRENSLYRELIINRGYLCLEHKNYSIIDNSQKPLIEWEKELGYCILNLSYSQHLKKCTKKEAAEMLYGHYLTQSWNEFADNIYSSYVNGLLGCEVASIDTDNKSLKKIEYNEVTPVAQEITEPVLMSDKLSKRERLFKKIQSIGCKISERVDERIVKVNNRKNKVKVRHSGIKMLMSVTLSLVTTVSLYGFSRMKPVASDNGSNLTYSASADDVINLNKNISLFEKVQTTNNYSISNSWENKEDTSVSASVTTCEKTVVKEKSRFKKMFSKFFNELQSKNNVQQVDNGVNLGDEIVLEKGTKVYDNVYSSIDKSNGYDTYYSNDMYRRVNYVALNYDDNIIFSNDSNEINYYKSKGAQVVSVCTDDGFYNVNDVKVKVKKR